MGNNILLGAIAGDIIGSAYEFNATKDNDFLLFSEMKILLKEYNAKKRKSFDVMDYYRISYQ